MLFTFIVGGHFLYEGLPGCAEVSLLKEAGLLVTSPAAMEPLGSSRM